MNTVTEAPNLKSISSALTLDDVIANVVERRDEFAAQRHVPRDMIEQFKQVGIYRAATPQRFGGDALPPARFLETVEKISAADGSAGWVASFGSALVYLAALPVETQQELYADGPDVVFAGGLFPVQPAERVDGGYRVSGQWKFASGCKGADILGVGINGGAATGGKPLTALMRPDQVEIIENWNVLGLEGTGSHELRVDNVVVPEKWTFVRGGQSTVDEPLYRYPSIAYAAQVLAVVNLGIGRAALDYAVEVGAGAQGITGAPKLADRAYYRIDIAKAEASLRSARAFFYDVTEEAFESILRGDAVSDKQAALLRLAATHATKAGAAATAAAFALSGTGAIYDGHPMQRYLRDAQVPSQHAFLGDGIFDSAGAVLMGIPPFPGFI